MSGKSTRSSQRKTKKAQQRRATKNDQALDRPFDPALLKRARKIATQYRVVLQADEERGYTGRALELPTGFAHGATPDECVAAALDGLTAAVATMLEMGQRPPAPASASRRQQQINVRVSAEEKLVMEEAARRTGFRGVSDFVRSAALERASARLPRARK